MIMLGRRAEASTSTAAAASCSDPRAQMHTRQPSATSARALASPSPRLEPVTIAILSVSPRSIRSARLLRPSAGEIVQPPVERLKGHAELVFLDELSLERQQP